MTLPTLTIGGRAADLSRFLLPGGGYYFDGQTGVALCGGRLERMPFLLRFHRCQHISVRSVVLARPTGPADPDGQCVQLDKCAGEVLILHCRFIAGPGAEDLVNLYGDEKRVCRVYIDDCEFVGRGKSESSTSVCCDGPHAPTLTLGCGNDIRGARVAVQLSGGQHHYIDKVKLQRCEHGLVVGNEYGQARRIMRTLTTAHSYLGPGDRMRAATV